MWHFPRGKRQSHVTAVDGQLAVSTSTGRKAHPAQTHSVCLRYRGPLCCTSHGRSGLLPFIPVPGPVSTSMESRRPAGPREGRTITLLTRWRGQGATSAPAALEAGKQQTATWRQEGRLCREWPGKGSQALLQMPRSPAGAEDRGGQLGSSAQSPGPGWCRRTRASLL